MRFHLRLLVLFTGCVVLGLGVAMLLTADLGSDGYSTLVHGLSLRTGIAFWSANLVVGVRLPRRGGDARVYPGLGTIVQVLLVGGVVTWLLQVLDTPGIVVARALLLVAAMPVLGIGIAAYLGTPSARPGRGGRAGLGPPGAVPLEPRRRPARRSLVGWLARGHDRLGTLAVILLLGPLVDLTSRLLRLDVHQGRTVLGARPRPGDGGWEASSRSPSSARR